MLYIKDKYPYEQYENIFLDLWVWLWQEHKDISKPDVLASCLFKHFSDKAEVEKIVKAGANPVYKQKLNDQTKMLVEEKGAFGAPWWWVKNKEGREEPFFGSDR